MASQQKTKPIKAILFDCDNTLVLSEELAFEGCAELINEICVSKGLSLPPFTGDTLIKEFVGQNFRGMMATLQKQHGFDLTPEELESYVKREEDVVIAKLKSKLKPCVGVTEQLKALEADGSRTLAVVSSSALRRVQASLDKVEFDPLFGPRVYSAATSIDPPTSKPDPAVYLHAMRELGFEPGECVAVEDSRSGTLSATRAKIVTIGYVGPYPKEEKEKMVATLKEAGAAIVMHDWAEFPDCLRKIETGAI